jgi:glucosamine--fructose-6-phosphate aminotransferase (isomerizing)
MNVEEQKYGRYALVREMMETVEVVRNFDLSRLEGQTIISERLLLSGEGSSRIFPAKRFRAQALRDGASLETVVEGATQALEYALAGYHVFIASNSGKTAEGVRLLRSLRAQNPGPVSITAVAANADAPIPKEADAAYILSCGSEEAVAATKSVVEQALYYDILYRTLAEKKAVDFGALAEAMEGALRAEIPREITDSAVSAPMIYFAGRNDGVAEELTLKTNEITRKKSDFLEGTYAVHGIEEVMRDDELVVLVNPFPAEEEKFERVLEQGVGLRVVAIADRETRFPTITVPEAGEMAPYVQLLAGWNLLVEIGIATGINLDKPERARKVGNEFTG